MTDNPEREGRGLLRSRVGAVLLVFLAVAAFFLVYEHRAHVLTGDGLVIALLAGCILMHLFMHHGHGGSGRDDHDGNGDGGRP